MGRKAKPIDGVVDAIGEVTEKAGKWRLRFKQNGIWDERTHSQKRDAEALRESLLLRQATNRTDINSIFSTLTAEQAKQAELAFRILANANLVDLGTNRRANAIVDAATLYVKFAEKQEAKVKIESAYTLFLAKQNERNLSPHTIADYKRYVWRFVEPRSGRDLASIDPTECKDWVYSFGADTTKHNCWGYLQSFFAFCAGKHNHHCNNSPWIARSPMNFPKPGYTAGEVHCYSFPEVKTLLKTAHKNGQLGNIVLRLFSMMRFEETLKFIKLGGTSFTDNPYINLQTGKITLPPGIVKNKAERKLKGRTITIHPVFAAWITYCQKHGIGFGYNEPAEIATRTAIGGKYGEDKGFTNLVRHTAITFRLKLTDDINATAYEAGNTPAVITKNYLNQTITPDDAKQLYAYTPVKAGFRT